MFLTPTASLSDFEKKKITSRTEEAGMNTKSHVYNCPTAGAATRRVVAIGTRRPQTL